MHHFSGGQSLTGEGNSSDGFPHGVVEVVMVEDSAVINARSMVTKEICIVCIDNPALPSCCSQNYLIQLASQAQLLHCSNIETLTLRPFDH